MSSRIVLAPYLCGAFARLLIYRSRREPWIEAAPGVYCGRLLTRNEAMKMRAMGITGVLDMTAEHAEARSLLETDYLNIPVLDLTRPSPDQINRAIAFISEHTSRGGAYIHCALGISRSVAVADAFIETLQGYRVGHEVTTSEGTVDLSESAQEWNGDSLLRGVRMSRNNEQSSSRAGQIRRFPGFLY